MTAGSGLPSTVVNAGSTSTVCACRRSQSETAGRLPSATPETGCDWSSSWAGRRARHRRSAVYPHPPRGQRLRRHPRTGVANQNRLPVSRPGQVNRIARLSRPGRRPCRRSRNRPGLTHRRDRRHPRSCPPEHSDHLRHYRNRAHPPAGHRNRNHPNSARVHRHRLHSCPPDDFEHRSNRRNPLGRPPRLHHRYPGRRWRIRNRPGRNPNRRTIGPNRRRHGWQRRSVRGISWSNA